MLLANAREVYLLEPHYCSNSSSLIGEHFALYYFARRGSTAGTMLEGGIKLWEFINSKRRPSDNEVDIYVAFAKIDPTKDEAMTSDFFDEQALLAHPHMLQKYHNPVVQPCPARQNVERRNKSQEKDETASDYVQQLYQDPESKLHHGFNQAPANHMSSIFASKLTFGADKKQRIWEAFPCELGDPASWPSKNQTQIQCNSADIAEYFGGILPEKGKFPPIENDDPMDDVERPPPAPTKNAKKSESALSMEAMAGALTSSTTILVTAIQSMVSNNNNNAALSAKFVTFQFTHGAYSICHVVDLRKETTFKHEFVSLMKKEFGAGEEDGEWSGVFTSLSDNDFTELKNKTRSFFFEIPQVGKLCKTQIEMLTMAMIEEMTSAARPIIVNVYVEAQALSPVDKSRAAFLMNA
jgi:hypothetical protein